MPARFVVRLTPSFLRDLDALPRASQEKVLDAVRRLETNPSGPSPKIKKLKGKGVGQWRLEEWRMARGEFAPVTPGEMLHPVSRRAGRGRSYSGGPGRFFGGKTNPSS